MSTFNSCSRGTGGARGRPLSALALGLVLTALALAGCGASSSQGSTAQSTTIPNQITIADDQVVTGLDPIVNEDYEFDQVTLLWGGYLTTYGPGAPELASTVTSSDDYKVWTVTLRPGVRFSDGAPIQASDVVASFERIAKTPGTDSDIFMGPFFTDLSSVTADGRSTTVFKFALPEPDFAKQVSIPEFAILPASGIAKGAAFWKHPISAGRYVIDSADLVDGSFRFSLNPYYPLAHPKVKTIVLMSVPDPATRLAELKSGEIQYAENIPGDYIPQITGNLRLDPAPWFGGFVGLEPNLQKGALLSNVRIRQAINLAVNRQQISQTALGGDIAGRPLYGIPWTQTAATPGVAPFPQSITKAKALLKGTPCQDGCTLDTTYNTNQVWQLPAGVQVLAQQLKKIGITLALHGTLENGSPYTAGWELRFWVLGDYDNSATFLSNLYVGEAYLKAEGFSDPVLSALAAKIAVASPAQLPALVDAANKAFAQYLPEISLTTLTYVGATSLPKSVMTNTGVAYFDIG